MSEAALKAYEEARVQQLTRNEARRIRTKVSDARNNPDAAGQRWPFELLQNAHDAGPYDGRESIHVSLTWEQILEGKKLIFEHDGAPFSLRDLAALLSGGSSKDFDSEDTTGRFGTGFLVTHVLATEARVSGILDNSNTLEHFKLWLDRSGDEDEIVENIEKCNQAIKGAAPLVSVEGQQSARFEYVVDKPAAFLSGFNTLRESLPYLFGTCPKLGAFLLHRPDGVLEEWLLERIDQHERGGVIVEDRSLLLSCSNDKKEKFRCLRIHQKDDDSAAAVVVVRSAGRGWEACIPDSTFPRIFRRFPIQPSNLSLGFILEGAFDVDQERQRTPLTTGNKALLSRALGCIPAAVEFAYEDEWVAKHLLSQVEAPLSTPSGNADDLQWWRDELSQVANALAHLPLVESPRRAERGPAASSNGDWYTDFILPQLNEHSQEYEVSMARVWPLVDQLEDYDPPPSAISEDWTKIAKGWANLGVELRLMSLEGIADDLKSKGKRLDELPITGDRKAWFATFFDVIGECWMNRQSEHAAALDGLLPDQNGNLRSRNELRRDGGVSEVLKDIAEVIGINIRHQLLDKDLSERATEYGLSYFTKMVETMLPQALDEAQVLERCIIHLSQKMKEGDRATDRYVEGSIKLLARIWEYKGRSGDEMAKRIPLIASDGVVVTWSATRRMMAPVSTWNPNAQPFWGAYPPQRVLAAVYIGTSGVEVVTGLINWGMAISDPLTKNTPELKDKRLKALAAKDSNTDDVTVSGVEFSHIALLHDAVLLRCQESVKDAKQLLGLVLTYAARHDPLWRTWIDVRGRKERSDVMLKVRGALWIADLTSKAWVPIEGGEESGKAPATAATIKGLLEPEWLIGNDEGIALLNECFGFDSLESRLLGVEPEKRQEMRDGLARLVDLSKSDPESLSKLADEAEAQQRRKRDVARWQRLGLSVQAAVKKAIEATGLEVKLVDRGFDYEVFLKQEGEIEDADLAKLEIGSYFLEVKATTQGEARMTPPQAAHATANAERYALCVIDLRGVPHEDLDRDWDAEDVEVRSHIVTDIGGRVCVTKELIDAARSNDVGIRNDAALRYGVPVEVWDVAFTISDWVESISTGLSKSAA